MNPTQGTPEPDTLAALRAGDEAAFRELLRRHHAPMVRMARGYVGSEAVAEEVAQETWAAVLDGLEGFEGRSSLRTWIFRILVKRAISRAEREGRTTPLSAIASDDGDAVDAARFDHKGHWTAPDRRPRRWDDDTPEKLALSVEAREVIDRAIESLPPNQRAVITLRDVQGWESKEVCNVLELSETNQRVLLHRARVKVRAALESYLDPEVADA